MYKQSTKNISFDHGVKRVICKVLKDGITYNYSCTTKNDNEFLVPIKIVIRDNNGRYLKRETFLKQDEVNDKVLNDLQEIENMWYNSPIEVRRLFI